MSFPLMLESENKIQALVASINGKYFGERAYISHKDRAVAYLYFIIKDHPFVDGNKRVACISFETVCAINKITPNYRDFRLDELAVFIEKNKRKNYQKFIHSIANLLFLAT